ncbi:cupin domain-containing protein [Citrobacter enshiensis]|uniref:Cupin domain-containing protein n=1 Tax=Citrobacter enshiensis TaxID=2971264 RepID=A0ABT8PWI3_9ENTR|nr:cupin domain-containing protein [Citrobacter enshiensis]MDN8600746.1 cupin domain-containing protein [Citrobacter enshiensis]WET40686.1 cupin domain-containing protein [Citrobacter enshiensis]
MFVLHSNTVKDNVGEGVSRQLLAHNGSLMAVEVEFDEGAIGPLHSHPHEQLTYVLAGEFEFTIGEETQVVTQGDTLYKRPHIMHGCVCLKAGKLLDIFTPIREDFLPPKK